MRNRVPVAAADRPPIPEFTPVPRKYRHDGWTPERQKAFIEALADCGSVTRAAAAVNMSQANCYTLRRAPGAESFRAAWDAALDFGVKRLKDIAFERAIDGQLHPVIRNGKLVGFHRKKNDALLMFCLRHYGQDANGKRTTINYFSTKAVAGAASGEAGAVAGAEASTTTVRTVIAGSPSGANENEAAEVLNHFEGVALDAEARGGDRGGARGLRGAGAGGRRRDRRGRRGLRRGRSRRAVRRPAAQRHRVPRRAGAAGRARRVGAVHRRRGAVGDGGGRSARLGAGSSRTRSS